MRNAMNGCGLLGLALFCSLASVDITAADSEVPIVVTAHRSVTPQSKVGSSFTVITEEQIEQSQRTHVSEILRDVPGIDVVRSGGRGGNTSIFLRGANSEQTLVLLDGIELNNPGNPARAFNFADLTLENVERIEILRGPQSGLYGSDAIGGVINIITKTGEKGTSAEVSSEAGSFDRYVQRARVSHGVQGGNLSLGVTREDEGGISAAEERDGNSEDDGFENTSVTLRAQLQPSETLTIDNTFRYNRSSTDLDNAGGFLGDDPNRELDNEQLFWRTAASARFFDGVWTPTVGVSLSDHEFTDRNDSDPAHVGETLDSRFSGRLLKFDFINTIQLSDEIRLVAGMETEQEKASSRYVSHDAFGPFESLFDETDVRTNGYFVDVLSDFTENFSTSAAVRVDDHGTFGSEVTYRISPVYRVSESGTKLRASVGSGFKAPSLNQLFSSFGNRDLEPEESVGWEVGFDQLALNGMVSFGATFYRQDIDQLVTFNSETFILENIAEAEITGFETYVEAEPVSSLLLRADYTYLDAENKSTNEQLLRRAQHRISLRSDYRFAAERASLGVRVQYVSARDDNDFSAFPATRTELSGYTLVDLLGSYEVSEEVRLFARIENLFDEEYQDVLGFGTYGVAGFGGVELRL